MSIALVVPTVREEQLLMFLESWQGMLQEARVATYIVEDHPKKLFRFDASGFYNLNYLTWESAPPGMLDCIHLNSPCCRQIGFWKAYQDEHEVIVTLDDDVRPAGEENPFLKFADILTRGLPLWVDPLLNYRSRGYPEENDGRLNVFFHVGSFLTIPDVDGETHLKYGKEFPKNPPAYVSRPTIVAHDQLLPVNGGVCAFKREIVPYLHYSSWCAELNYRRFDDIWMGILLKRWMDLCGLRMSYGPPFVDHIRASDAEKNREYEKEGKKWNELFWQQLDALLSRTEKNKTYTRDEAFELLTTCLSRIDNAWARKEAEDMNRWKSLFSS